MGWLPKLQGSPVLKTRCCLCQMLHTLCQHCCSGLCCALTTPPGAANAASLSCKSLACRRQSSERQDCPAQIVTASAHNANCCCRSGGCHSGGGSLGLSWCPTSGGSDSAADLAQAANTEKAHVGCRLHPASRGRQGTDSSGTSAQAADT